MLRTLFLKSILPHFESRGDASGYIIKPRWGEGTNTDTTERERARVVLIYPFLKIILVVDFDFGCIYAACAFILKKQKIPLT